jgi:hypothetical protein
VCTFQTLVISNVLDIETIWNLKKRELPLSLHFIVWETVLELPLRCAISYHRETRRFKEKMTALGHAISSGKVVNTET